jgi:hypothetical protein
MNEITIIIPEWMIWIAIPSLNLSSINAFLEIRINHLKRKLEAKQNKSEG